MANSSSSRWISASIFVFIFLVQSFDRCHVGVSKNSFWLHQKIDSRYNRIVNGYGWRRKVDGKLEKLKSWLFNDSRYLQLPPETSRVKSWQNSMWMTEIASENRIFISPSTNHSDAIWLHFETWYLLWTWIWGLEILNLHTNKSLIDIDQAKSALLFLNILMISPSSPRSVVFYFITFSADIDVRYGW